MNRRHVFQCVAFAVVVWIAWMNLSVRSIDSSTFEMHAVELERTRGWRYGYVAHYRGGTLVRTRLGVDAPPLTPVEAADTIAPTKVRTLHKQQRTAAVGSVLCGLWWSLWFNGFLRIRADLSARKSRQR